MKSYVCATLPATLSIIEMINTNLRCGLYFYVLIGGMHIIFFVNKNSHPEGLFDHITS